MQPAAAGWFFDCLEPAGPRLKGVARRNATFGSRFGNRCAMKTHDSNYCAPQPTMARPGSKDPIFIGKSTAFAHVLDLIDKVSRCDVSVLIQGETGTGKELAARAIHYSGARRDAPFVPINCGAIPDTLIESELFGHVRGAFTDARESRAGVVSQAEGGTLFLDEIAAMSVHAQVALLRFLQSLEYW